MSVVDSIDDYAISLRPNISQWSAQANASGEYQLAYKSSSYGELFMNRLDSADGGPFRTLQLAEKVCNLLSFAGYENQFKYAAKIFNGGWTATIYPHLPGVFKYAKESVSKLMTPQHTDSLPGFLRRKWVGAIQEVSSLGSSLAYAAAPFLSLSEKTAGVSSSVLKMAEVTTLTADVCELQKSSEDFAKTRAMEKRAEELNVSSELLGALKQSSQFHLLRTVKATCSVSYFLLGGSLTMAGFSKFRSSKALLSAVSLLGTVLAASTGIFKEGMKYKPVDFFDSKQVQQITKSA